MEKKINLKKQYGIETDKLFETKLNILKTIDKICSDNQLTYFAFGKLLVGCVHYQSEIPEPNPPWDLGLLRPDYEKLIHILENPSQNKNLYFDKYYDHGPYLKELFRVGMTCRVSTGDFYIEEPCWIYLSPFDYLPEDFDCFCGFIRKMRRRNKYYSLILRVFTRNQFLAKMAKHIWKYIDTPSKAITRRNKIAESFLNSSYQNIGRVVFKKTSILTSEQLFPIQKLPFGDFMLPCPSDYSAWTTPMTPSLQKQTMEIQKVDLYVLKEFDRVCRLLNLGYFICGGTLLGSIRHKGFIPWDDDIDVGMIREDYNRFLKEAGKHLGSQFFLQTRETDPEIPYLFSKIRVNGTEYITHYNENRNFHKGICLDIFPFDVLPDTERQFNRFIKKTNRLIKIHNLVCNKQLPEPSKIFSSHTWEERWWHFIGKTQRKLFKCIPLTFTQHRYIKHVTKYNHLLHQKPDCELASFVPTYTHIKTSDLLPYQDAVFENLTVKVPHRPDVFLTMQYKDYMSHPPVHQQEGHELIRYSAQINSNT